MNTVHRALIPAGGYGTRFLPATKSTPKELFPLGNKPIILHVVEECVSSGITEIILVISHNKQAIQDLFSPNKELYDFLCRMGKEEQAQEIQRIATMAEFSFIHTRSPHGNGQALISAHHLLKDSPFVVTWSDELILSKAGPRIKQCLEVFHDYQLPVISGTEIADPKKRSHYGIAEFSNLDEDDSIKVLHNIHEKPALGSEPSSLAAHGAYILTPDIFDVCDLTDNSKNKEVVLTDLINLHAADNPYLIKVIPEATYLDCGQPLTYLQSQIEYALHYGPNQKEAKKIFTQNNNLN